MQTELYGKQVETFRTGVSVSTGLTYLQLPGLKQLLTCVWQTPGPLIKTQALDILNSALNSIILYFYFSHKIVGICCFYWTGLHMVTLSLAGPNCYTT